METILRVIAIVASFGYTALAVYVLYLQAFGPRVKRTIRKCINLLRFAVGIQLLVLVLNVITGSSSLPVNIVTLCIGAAALFVLPSILESLPEYTEEELKVMRDHNEIINELEQLYRHDKI